MGIRLLVCGGRDFDDEETLFEQLTYCHIDNDIDVIMHGNAKGADRLAGKFARQCEPPIKELKFPADWDHHGKIAGPIRNQRMIDEGKPDVVIAFPGGRGTADMVNRARRAGIKVIEIGEGST